MKRSDRLRTRAFPAAPPPPEVSTAMAQQGIDLNRGNSDQQPLAPEGKEEVREVAQKLAAKGGLDELKTSGTVRGEQTAQAIAEAGASPKPGTDGDLSSWATGNLEGQPTALVRDQIRDLVRNNPSVKIPGQGALSSRPGESFDDFRTSRLSAIRGAMQELAENPTAKIGRTTHTQVIKLLRGWLANGTPDDFSIKPEHMEDKVEAPGQVVRLFPEGEKGKWKLEDVNLEDSKPLDSGVYLIRHGMTPWNKETYEKANGQQDAIAKLTDQVKRQNWKGVQDVASKAVQGGHLDENQATQAIDAALPAPEDAAKMPLHRLIAVASAASPQKRQDYAPLIQNYPGLDTLPPDAKGEIMNHMRLIGLGG